MEWVDVAMILFSCVAMNHLGLIHAIEGVLSFKIPIVNCPRCISFWCTLAFLVLSHHRLIVSVATSFLCAATAPWIDLMMGYIDIKFNSLYDKIFPTDEDAHHEKGGTETGPAGSVS